MSYFGFKIIIMYCHMNEGCSVSLKMFLYDLSCMRYLWIHQYDGVGTARNSFLNCKYCTFESLYHKIKLSVFFIFWKLFTPRNATKQTRGGTKGLGLAPWRAWARTGAAPPARARRRAAHTAPGPGTWNNLPGRSAPDSQATHPALECGGLPTRYSPGWGATTWHIPTYHELKICLVYYENPLSFKEYTL